MKRSEFLMRNNSANLEKRKNAGLKILKNIKNFLGHNQKLSLSKFIVEYYEPLFDDLIDISIIIQNPNEEEGIVECYNRKTGTVWRLTEEQFTIAKGKLGESLQIIENPMQNGEQIGLEVDLK